MHIIHTAAAAKVIIEKSRAVGDFYGTGIEIWAGFGPIGRTEKRVLADYEQVLRVFFHVFRGKKNVKIVLKTL